MKRLRQALSCLLLCALLACAISAPASAVSDVPGDFWAKGDIERCVALKYFYPESDGSFGVGKEMTRAEFLVVVCRLFGWKPAAPARPIYQDVDEKAWYAGAVEAAYHHGAITSQDGNFRPDALITRSEAASMLVRALGYGSIAGLIQDTPLPFQDVHANNGYVIMAYGMGLMDGASVTSFSPDGHVTREQAAVIVMRLHDKLHDATTSRIGVATSALGLPDVKDYEAVAVAAFKLAYNGAPQLAAVLKEDEARAARDAIAAAGSRPLLYVTGTNYHLREGDAEKMAQTLLQGVKDGGYEGLFLDISGLTSVSQRDELTATARLLREGLGEGLLYIGAEAPTWKGEVFGYDYALLGEIADRLVLRVTQKGENAGGLSTAPLEPLERVYYGLSRLRGVVDAGKLSLMLTSAASLWDGEKTKTLDKETLTEYLGKQNAHSHYSSRYACAYLPLEEGGTVWYHNAQSIAERIQLARLFSGGHLCLSDLNNALPEVLEAMP